MPGARELLDELRPRYRLAALSNSNAAHWERLAELGVLDAFELAVGSQQLGVRKPAAEAFGLTVVTNEATGTNAVLARRTSAGSEEETATPLGLAWPREIFSLSHVALPFPPQDDSQIVA